ncbi:MAG: glutathione S-transferase [Haliea sp.]|jgi:glutathione S-transferase|uniref:glutathione S-transferase family protein n=1 Tax=Haliea sp. TaxID=1932666 RepID=UPI000C5EBD65|nr:glutathione S-transferase family protein [Haliea sp.]MBM69718.1 glutathione S-transferase [Haliea sp.]|tara:strand:- start:92280 stop:92912 length:633 start_codon:yes stop_codon:yes gene_type:complete
MKLWHCGGARSLRPLWTLEELGLDYELEVLPFPPRVMQPDYLKVNSLGTVPYFVDGDTVMTESVGICQYLVDRYEDRGLGLRPEHPDYGAYLNWLHHSDATLTFPQTIALRYYFFEPDPAKRAVADDYAKWFRARLRRLDECLERQAYLVAERFTVADIAIGYALYLGQMLHLDKYYKPATADYLQRLMARPGFQRANAQAEPLVLPDVV